MRRMPFAVSLSLVAVLALALALPGKAVAGPPEGVSGRMVLDEIEYGLWKFRTEKNERKRIWWLDRLVALDRSNATNSWQRLRWG